MRARSGFAVLVGRGSSEGLHALFQTGAGWGACVHGVAGASSRRACCSEVALAEVAACRAMSEGEKCDGRPTTEAHRRVLKMRKEKRGANASAAHGLHAALPPAAARKRSS